MRATSRPDRALALLVEPLVATLFDRIVATTGLTPVVAPYTVRRLLRRDGVIAPEEVTVTELRRVLPNLLAALEVYLPRDELQHATEALQALVAT